MMSDLQKLEDLFERYLTNRCSAAEVEQLMHYFQTDEQEVLAGLIEREMARTAPELSRDYEPLFDEVYRDIQFKIAAPRRTYRLWPRIAAAASILIAVSAGGYFILQKAKPVPQVAQVKYDVLPGGNKAYLTLGNGQRISLTDAKNGTIASQGGKSIQKTAEGMIVYDNTHSNHSAAENIYNTIETPRGGQYQVVLPDGSKVWLNAASSLKYPAAFKGTDRLVELTGEAYFEVAKDKAHPFKVKTTQQEVEVLGTHFDVNSYADEAHVSTTLLEGSVKVTGSDKKQIVIKPGEQAINDGRSISVQQADADNVIDWKDGDFFLNHVPFKVAMRKIARWYDVEVVYETNIPDQIESGGWIKRSRELSKVLGAIERSGQVHFKIEGKKIYVSK